MAIRVTAAERLTTWASMPTWSARSPYRPGRRGSTGLYSSIVTTAPGAKTRVHHHGTCETSIFILEGSARYTWGPTGLEQAMHAGTGDFVYIPAGEIHVEENASPTEPLVVVLTRNCPDSHVVYLDDGPPGTASVAMPGVVRSSGRPTRAGHGLAGSSPTCSR